MVLLGLLAPAAARWTRGKATKRTHEGGGIAVGRLSLSRYGPQVMSVLCLRTSLPQSNPNNRKNSASAKIDLVEEEPTPVSSVKDISTDELALLAKLEEANRLIESDAKSLNSLQSNHSRKGSDTSQVSLASGGSSGGGDAAPRRHSPTDGEENIWTLWGHIVADWENYSKKKKEFVKELVRKGIPHHFRGIVWQLLCGAHDAPVKKQFAEYIKATSACERVIRRDIARTYPEHDFFKEKDGLGQESLFNVMKAYSLHDREVGYCQGSGFIVGLLLMQQMPEEEAFAVLVALMQEYRLRDMFKPSMAELGVCMYQLEHLVADTHPELHAHFTAQGFHTSMYASSWFLTLFTTALSLPLACRIFDVFLSEGMEVIFKVALAMLHLGKEDLLSLDMEGMLKFFQKELPGRAEADPDGLMNLAYEMRINQKRMKKLEKDYTVLKMKEQEEMVELRRLRAENRLLRQRTELLEAESAELADRLVRGQVSRAEEEETTFVVQRELAALKHTHLETNHQLEIAHEELRSLSILLEENLTSKQSSLDEMSLKQKALSEKEEMLQCLQQELVKVRLHEAENDATIRDLRARIQELEEDKKTLRESRPDNSVAHLQEELIAVKLREAEANLSLKDLRQRVTELSSAWQRHLQEHRSAQPAPAADSTPKKLLFWENRGHETQRLEEDLMTTRIREMEALTEVKELRLKVMELETQVQVATNQLRRQDEGGKQLREELDEALIREKDLTTKLREQQHKYSDLESKMKDEFMMARIRDAEHAQQVAELTHKISLLELKNEEMYAEGELRNNLDDSERVKELQDKVADLKAEVMRLESWKQRWTGKDGPAIRSISVDTESELDERDLRICLQDPVNASTPSPPDM
ncbi:ecotropic viral integration site 5 ortholog isoform X1 [Neodiprion pinetum]|uniref:Ecotropic viral integration site 5 ortholog isoform X1 n=2 Tax=Neodiprion lecontei TaxID=441921 RepID=A0A6J0BIU8_NEOLC|nr:ecotropic viral integration site 5 ortholog isoform X1 [Neodiprion lecontei]XP_046492389.1 ecotropic viral integration site 5 ortholog isoform X1 [Neodiprion pinetum]XP_046601824.1 ecotropic viral integration site 5 ortholog isoform X1 [Neodiprion lecontei]